MRCPVASQTRPGALMIDVKGGFAFPAFDLAIERLPALAAARRASPPPASSALASFRRGRPPRRAAGRGGPGGAGVRQYAQRHRAVGRQPLGVRHQSDRLRRTRSGTSRRWSSTWRSARWRAARSSPPRRRASPFPPDWAVDADGKPTTDAAAALKGTLLPIGGAKGAALALMVEVLAVAAHRRQLRLRGQLVLRGRRQAARRRPAPDRHRSRRLRGAARCSSTASPRSRTSSSTTPAPACPAPAASRPARRPPATASPSTPSCSRKRVRWLANNSLSSRNALKRVAGTQGRRRRSAFWVPDICLRQIPG